MRVKTMKPSRRRIACNNWSGSLQWFDITDLIINVVFVFELHLHKKCSVLESFSWRWLNTVDSSTKKPSKTFSGTLKSPLKATWVRMKPFQRFRIRFKISSVWYLFFSMHWMEIVMILNEECWFRTRKLNCSISNMVRYLCDSLVELVLVPDIWLWSWMSLIVRTHYCKC